MNRHDGIDQQRRRVLAAMGALAVGLKVGRARAQAAAPVRFLSARGTLPQSVLAGFAAHGGSEVAVEIYDDAPALYSKVRARDAAYDVIVAPERLVPRMIFANLLQNIDPKQVPNLSNLDAAFTNAAFDPGRRYSVAYLWGTLGVGYRRSVLGVEPGSWKWIFDSDRYDQRIAWLSDAQLTLGCALKYQAHSANTLEVSELVAAADLLTRQRPHVAQLTTNEGVDLLLDKKVDLVMARAGDVVRAFERDPDVAYVVPGEGSLLLQDCLCIPRRATNPRAAHAFIDYLLGADVGAEIARTLRYATPNAAARARLPEAVRSDLVTFPDEQVLARSEIITYRGERVVARYDREWQRVNAKS